MKKIKILYWVSTGLFAAFMLLSAIPDILSLRDAVEIFSKLKLPAYLLPFLGIAKALGAISIIVPGNRRIKEWAYAGLFFDLAGATYCMMATGLPISGLLFMSVPLMLLVASYRLHHRISNSSTSPGNTRALSNTRSEHNKTSKALA